MVKVSTVGHKKAEAAPLSSRGRSGGTGDTAASGHQLPLDGGAPERPTTEKGLAVKGELIFVRQLVVGDACAPTMLDNELKLKSFLRPQFGQFDF